MIKKLISIGILCATLIVVGCGEKKDDDLDAKNQRDRERKDALHQITYALGQYVRETNEYPKATENWCADDLIKFLEDEQGQPPLTGPKPLVIGELGDCNSRIYYFFRDNNPDYYTFAIKLENDYLGSSYLSPKEVVKLSLEELRDIRLGSLEESATARGNYYYIIGNYPHELLPKPKEEKENVIHIK